MHGRAHSAFSTHLATLDILEMMFGLACIYHTVSLSVILPKAATHSMVSGARGYVYKYWRIVQNAFERVSSRSAAAQGMRWLFLWASNWMKMEAWIKCTKINLISAQCGRWRWKTALRNWIILLKCSKISHPFALNVVLSNTFFLAKNTRHNGKGHSDQI